MSNHKQSFIDFELELEDKDAFHADGVFRMKFLPWCPQVLDIRVRHRGPVPPKMNKTKNLKFSLKGHEKPKLNSEFRHDSVKFVCRIAIYVLCSKIA